MKEFHTKSRRYPRDRPAHVQNSRLMLGGIARSNPNQADYTTCSLADTPPSGTSPGSLFILNPATGVFDAFGAFVQPSQLNSKPEKGNRVGH